MKKIRLIAIILSFSLGLKAQYFNISMGLNMAMQERSTYPYDKATMKSMLALNSQIGYEQRLWQYIYYGIYLGYDQTGIEYSAPQYNQSFSYIQVINMLKVQSTYWPIFFSIGFYAGVLVNASELNDGQARVLPLSQYSFYDYGAMPSIGLIKSYDFMRYYVELRYKSGLNDILKGQESIKNRAFSVIAGISFLIP